MGRRRKFGRPIDGVLILNKPAGMTSNHALQSAKRLFFASKAGHTGALDPLATGVLPLCFGEATKFSQFLLDADKTYISRFIFGVTTDTGDADGKVLSRIEASALSEKSVVEAVNAYRGDIDQVPPMYSALKKDGQPLYKLAREGIEVDREARRISIYSYELLEFREGENPEALFKVACSKGTYVRQLAQDLGRDLGVGAHVASLHRIQAGPFLEAQAISLAALETARGDARAETLDEYLLPIDSMIASMPKVILEESSSYYFCQGQAVMDNQLYRLGAEGDTVRVFRGAGEFLGVGQITDDGRVTPKRLVVH